jgi:hypothetical protein
MQIQVLLHLYFKTESIQYFGSKKGDNLIWMISKTMDLTKTNSRQTTPTTIHHKKTKTTLLITTLTLSLKTAQ